MRASLLSIALLVFAPAAFGQDLPDPQKTPGVALQTVPDDDKVLQCLGDVIGERVEPGAPITTQLICAQGYSKCIRNVSTQVKSQVYHSYGLSGNHTAYCNVPQGCEVDHLISLEIGGSNDPKNLWPQPFQGRQWNAHVKDQLENYLHAEVCAGRMPLARAQSEISTNWVIAYQKYLGNPE